MSPAQIGLAHMCERCGRPVPGDLEVALLVEGVERMLKGRKVLVPDAVYVNLGIVRQAMECRQRICMTEASG